MSRTGYLCHLHNSWVHNSLDHLVFFRCTLVRLYIGWPNKILTCFLFSFNQSQYSEADKIANMFDFGKKKKKLFSRLQRFYELFKDFRTDQQCIRLDFFLWIPNWQKKNQEKQANMKLLLQLRRIALKKLLRYERGRIMSLQGIENWLIGLNLLSWSNSKQKLESFTSKIDHHLLRQKVRQRISVIPENWHFNSRFVLKATKTPGFVFITEIL